jgi:hypothetical protein
MPLQRLRTYTAAFAVITMLASSAASGAPRTVDPLVALSVLGSSESRAAVCAFGSGAAVCSGGSMAAASAGAAVAVEAGAAQDDQMYASGATVRGSMWPLWVGLGAVAIFIAWDLLDDEDDDGEIEQPISP